MANQWLHKQTQQIDTVRIMEKTKAKKIKVNSTPMKRIIQMTKTILLSLPNNHQLEGDNPFLISTSQMKITPMTISSLSNHYWVNNKGRNWHLVLEI